MSDRFSFALYFAIGVCCALLTSGWYHADMEARFPSPDAGQCRDHSGFASGLSMLTVIAWPVLTPAAFFVTGFAQHGWMAPWGCDAWEKSR